MSSVHFQPNSLKSSLVALLTTNRHRHNQQAQARGRVTSATPRVSTCNWPDAARHLCRAILLACTQAAVRKAAAATPKHQCSHIINHSPVHLPAPAVHGKAVHLAPRVLCVSSAAGVKQGDREGGAQANQQTAILCADTKKLELRLTAHCSCRHSNKSPDLLVPTGMRCAD